ncbi:MAG: twitching motility protein PilT [Leptolyngbya sp. ERB_1_1]
MEIFVIDTHALAWFFAEDARLSPVVDNILTLAETSTTQILIPTLVLAELTMPVILEAIQQSRSFIIADFGFPVFQAFLELPSDWDLHDRIIAATAKCYSAKLITRDEVLRNSPDLETIWD